MLRRMLSALFWAFLVLSSVVMFPIALAIWIVTLPFDPRLRAAAPVHLCLGIALHLVQSRFGRFG